MGDAQDVGGGQDVGDGHDVGCGQDVMSLSTESVVLGLVRL